MPRKAMGGEKRRAFNVSMKPSVIEGLRSKGSIASASAAIEKIAERILADMAADERGAALFYNILAGEFTITYGKPKKAKE